MSEFISAELRAEVRLRAGARCEYCGIPDTATWLAHEVDHVIATQHRGKTTLENLALACFHCNRHKGPNLASIDPQTGEIVRLFNPRIDKWSAHFELKNFQIIGVTDVGRATSALFQFNSPQRLQARRLLMQSGLWS